MKIACGSDLDLPYGALFETEMLVKCGMTEHQAITAATLTSAQVCLADEKNGTVEPGKKADFIILNNNPLENICKKVGENLIQMYHSGSFNNLIFPLYRASKKKRVSEQEARFLFAYEIMKNGDFDFAVEVPTKLRYKGFSTHSPTVFFNDEDGRSASIDMSIFKKNDNKKPFINIEFKKGQPTQSSITKDLLKLLFEPHKYGIFFHILEHSDSRTLTSFVKKFNSSFNNISSQKLKTQCPIIFFWIVILEEDINESRYSGSDYDTSKTTKLDESNFQDL